jgi:lipoate-protein ligase A
VAVAAEWLGAAWTSALADLGRPGGTVHRGGLARTRLAPVVCFAGTGPGEVLVEGAKVVGISQRRTRAAARFQCSVPLTWDPERHAALLAPGVRRVAPGVEPARSLATVAVRPLVGAAPDEVLEALLANLP